MSVGIGPTVVQLPGGGVTPAAVVDAIESDPAAALAALGTSSVTTDPMTGAGWTTLPPTAGQTATWAASKLTLESPAGVNASGACGVHKSAILTIGDDYDVSVRLDVVSDGGAPGNCNLALSCGVDANNRVYWQMFLDGSFQAGGFVGGGWVAHLSRTGAEVSGGQLTGGDLWLRLTHVRGHLTFWWGVGSGGALPASWTRRLAVGVTANTNAQAVGGLRLGVEVDTGGTPGTAVTVDVLAIRTTERTAAP